MGGKMVHSIAAGAWALVKRQHGVISRGQLLALGFSTHAIDHRIETGRLHPVYAGVYAVGRKELSRLGAFIAAVLACGEAAALSHASAAELWKIRPRTSGDIEVSVASSKRVRRPGITVHRRATIETTRHHAIPVTTPICTLVDIASLLSNDECEAAIGEADKLDLVHPGPLRAALDEIPGRPGVNLLKRLIDRHTFVLTDTQLERWFLPIARRVGLPRPLTQVWVNGCRVDFYWPDIGLVVEADGGRYHRTPMQQTKDARRFQAHTAAGLVPLRFTHWQIRYAPDEVEAVLAAVVARLAVAATG
jgi:very-short-patch-repair endonuclease